MIRSMQRRLFSIVTASGLGLSLSALASAQDAPVLPPPGPDNAPVAAAPSVEGDDQFETLTRGPVHEAFAEQYNADPVEGLIVPKAPPEAIDELPPDQMPEGNNVEWVPGYWGWDDEREDYIWISGLWRDIPPGQRWVPGYWTEATGGYQWVSGFWTGEDTAELNYIQQPPPASLEQGPNIEAPGDDQFWVPGSWQYVEEDYRWRPGYYAPVYDEWVWVPDRFVWSPFGYVFCPGYWDYRLPSRGVMFAPVYFHHAHWWHHHHRPFTPGLVLDVGPLTLHWFVRPSYRHYYFGDYYADHYYSNWGVQPWYSCHFGFGGFGGFRHRRHCHYDPLLVFYSGYHRRHHRIDYRDRLSRWHRHYHDHEDFRPRRTAREQDAFIAAHEHGDERHKEVVRNVRLSRKLDEYAAQPADRDQRFVKLDETERDRRSKESKKIRDVAQMRHDVEAADDVVRVDRADRGRKDRDDAVVGNDPSNRDQGNDAPGNDSSSRDRNNGRDRNGRSGTPGDVADVTIPGTGGDASTQDAGRDTKRSRKLQLPEVEKKTDRTRELRGVVGAPQDPPGQTGNDAGPSANDRTRDARRTERSSSTDRHNNSNNNANRTPGVETGSPGATFPDGVTGNSRNRSTREGNSGNSNNSNNNSNNPDRSRQPRSTTRDQGGNNSGPAIVPNPTQPGSAIPDSGNSSNRNRSTRQQQRDTNSGSSFQPVPRSNPVPNNSGNSGSNRSNRSRSESNRSGSNQSGSFQSIPNNSAPSGETRSRSNSSRSNSGNFNSGSNNSNRSNSGSFDSGSRSNRSSNSGSFNSGSNRSSNSGSFNSGSRSNRSSNSGSFDSGSRSSRQSGNSGSRSDSGGRKGNKNNK